MEGICLKIYNLSAEYAKKVREKSNNILKEHGMELPNTIPHSNVRKVWCYPVQFAIACPRLPTVEYMPERDQALLRFQGETLAVNTTHLQKLVSIFFFRIFLLLWRLNIYILGTFISSQLL